MPRAPRRAQPRRQPRRRADTRPPSSQRGYNAEWRKVRAEVLRSAGIPRDQWRLYAVDHRPPYDPEVEPDHRKYNLVPMRKEEHNRKTATFDQQNERDHNGRWKRTTG